LPRMCGLWWRIRFIVKEKLFRWSLIAIALTIVGVTVYLYTLGMWLEALSFSGVTSVILWFMIRIIEKAR